MSEPGRPVANVADVPLIEWGRGEKYAAKLGRLGPLIGARKLGCTLHVVAAGKGAFPRHSHHANEEMYVVLSGAGEFRLGDRSYPVRAGDVVAAPSGGIETAHHIVNNSADELRYLCISTMQTPEVAEYPDSGKFGVYDSQIPFRFINRKEQSINYWEGEEK